MAGRRVPATQSVPYAGRARLAAAEDLVHETVVDRRSAVRILSRSMSFRTCSADRFECRASVSSSQVRIRSTSLAWISMSEAWP